jgi:hypothetical protein
MARRKIRARRYAGTKKTRACSTKRVSGGRAAAASPNHSWKKGNVPKPGS